jgi:hypothetical protein
MSQVIIEDPAWKAIMTDDRLAGARRKLSFHEIRLIINHTRAEATRTPEAALREALRFYADAWEDHDNSAASGLRLQPTWQLLNDEGDIAHAALAQVRHPSGERK